MSKHSSEMKAKFVLDGEYTVGTLREYAETGDANAQYRLGCHFYDDKDYKEAVHWLRLAADQGHVQAQSELGYCYYGGHGVSTDYTAAVFWLRQAAERGDARAQHLMSVCYSNGQGVLRDSEQAVRWLQLSKFDIDGEYNIGTVRKYAETGDANAQYRLGCHLYTNNKDYKEAVHWLQFAADQGHIKAQCDLGYCYYDGHGVSTDYERAIFWLRQAANRGDARAQHLMAVCYSNGQGVLSDSEQQIRWLQLAAAQKYAESEYDLGLCYYEGIHITKDLTQAAHFFRQAAAQGHREAQRLLGIVELTHLAESIKQKEATEKKINPLDALINKILSEFFESLTGKDRVEAETQAKIKACLMTQLIETQCYIDSSTAAFRVGTIRHAGEPIRINQRISLPLPDLSALIRDFASQFLEAFHKNMGDKSLFEEISIETFGRVFEATVLRSNDITEIIKNRLEIKRQKELQDRNDNLKIRFSSIRTHFNNILYVSDSHRSQRDVKYAIDCMLEDTDHITKETASLDEALRGISGSQSGRLENNVQRRAELVKIKKNLEEIKKEGALKKLQEEFEKAYEDREALIMEALRTLEISETSLSTASKRIAALENYVEHGRGSNKALSDIGNRIGALQQEVLTVWDAISRKIGRKEKIAKEEILNQREELRKKESAMRQARWEREVAKKEAMRQKREKALQDKLDREKALLDANKAKAEAFDETKKNAEDMLKKRMNDLHQKFDPAKILADLERRVVPLRPVDGENTVLINTSMSLRDKSALDAAFKLRNEGMRKLSLDELPRFLQEERLNQDCTRLKRILESLSWLNTEEGKTDSDKIDQDTPVQQRTERLIERNALLYVLAYMMDRMFEMGGINAFPMDTARKIRNHIFHTYGRTYLLSLSREASIAMKHMVLEILVYLQNQLSERSPERIDEATLLTRINSKLFSNLLTETGAPSFAECQRQMELTKKDFEEYNGFQGRQTDPNFSETINAAQQWTLARRGAFAAVIRDYFYPVYMENQDEYSTYIAQGIFTRHSAEEDDTNAPKLSFDH